MSRIEWEKLIFHVPCGMLGSYKMTRALCKVGRAGIAISFLDVFPEFGKSAIKELHTDFDHCELAPT